MTYRPDAFTELDPTTMQAPQNPDSFNTASDLATARGAATTAEQIDDLVSNRVAEDVAAYEERWKKDQERIAELQSQNSSLLSVAQHLRAALAAAPQAQPSPTIEQKQQIVKAFEVALKDFVAGYEVDTGEGIYQPTAHEQFLLDMAIRDAIHDDDFMPALVALATMEQAQPSPTPPALTDDEIREAVIEVVERDGFDVQDEHQSGLVESVAIAVVHYLSRQAAQPCADTARLDFVIERAAWISRDFAGQRCRVFGGDDNGGVSLLSGEGNIFDTPRAAIDAAIAAQEKKA